MAKAPAEIRSLARTHSAMAMRTLAEIARSRKAPPASRVAAATALLDRGWGKPDQTVNVQDKTLRDMTDAELIAIAAGSGEGTAETPLDPSKLN